MEISKHLKNSFLIVAHDSGTANQIYYYLKNYNIRYKTYTTGPAKKIFKKKNLHTLTKAIQISDIVLTGTSWQSKIEVKAIKQSKKLGKKVISFIDDISNLKYRFTLDKKVFFPDIIFVKNKETYDKCKKLCPQKVKVIQIKDHFLNYAKKNKTKPKKDNILYMSSNYDELRYKIKKNKDIIDMKLLNIFKKKLEKINYLNKKKIYLRLHPSESIGKYENNSEFKDMNIEVLKKNDLLKCFKNFKYVFGCETYGLVIAKNYGLTTFNNIINTTIKSNLLKNYNIRKF